MQAATNLATTVTETTLAMVRMQAMGRTRATFKVDGAASEVIIIAVGTITEVVMAVSSGVSGVSVEVGEGARVRFKVGVKGRVQRMRFLE